MSPIICISKIQKCYAFYNNFTIFLAKIKPKGTHIYIRFLF